MSRPSRHPTELYVISSSHAFRVGLLQRVQRKMIRDSVPTVPGTVASQERLAGAGFLVTSRYTLTMTSAPSVPQKSVSGPVRSHRPLSHQYCQAWASHVTTNTSAVPT